MDSFFKKSQIIKKNIVQKFGTLNISLQVTLMYNGFYLPV